MRNNFVNLPDSFLAKPIAHRGFHNCKNFKKFGKGPENSRESVTEAIGFGFGVEIDVCFSKDYVPVVIHDQNLIRLCKKNINVFDSFATDLFKSSLKNGEFLPSLEEILSLVNGRASLLIEIKIRKKDQDIQLIAKKIGHLIRNYTGPVALMSFDWSLVKAFAKKISDIPRGLITQGFDQNKQSLISDHEKSGIKENNLLTYGISFISHYYGDLSEDFYKRNALANRKVLSWTVCTKEMSKRVKKKCDNITFEGFCPQTKKVRV